MSEWKTAGNGNRQTEEWNLEKNGPLHGMYVEKRVDVGPNKSNIYVFSLMTGDKKLVSVWGATVLDDRMSGVKIGDEVKIELTGTTPSKKNGRPIKLFDVMYRTPDGAKDSTDSESDEPPF